MDRIKNIIITVVFIIILIVILLINLLVKDKDVSISERRKLAQFPEISIQNLLSGKTNDEFEKYVVDQFASRDFFRQIKSFWSINIFKQKDDNKYFEKDGALYKMEYPLVEGNIEKSANKINEIYNKFLQGKQVYYAIIPDKNYYLENDDHLKTDYNKLKLIMNENLTNLTYIDIWKDLELDDFYRTDIHWKQENLQDVVNEIEKQMGLIDTSNIIYDKKDVGEFYGTYYSQISNNVKPDEMYILENDVIKNCSTYNFETEETDKVYVKKESNDKYDIFVSGATPLIEVNNPNCKTERELILFRDSFGSSLAPLLIENYKKITLVDLRYMSSSLLEEFIEFENQDVIFLYSSLVLNQNILK